MSARDDEALAEQVRQALKQVYDPEVGFNIVDLGLVYGIEAEDGKVKIAMTMTTPGCPATSYIEDGVREVAGQVPGVRQVEVELVWSPPWTPAMMSEAAKMYLRYGYVGGED
jgi:metal-sulfur cluster biosynthetic enzyme